jgi:hypothetical protein
MAEKPVWQRLIELQELSNLYQQQIRLATIAAYHKDQPPEVLINTLNETLAILIASIPKILIIKDQINAENHHSTDGLRASESESYNPEMAGN